MLQTKRVENKEFEALIGKYSTLISKVCYFYATDAADFADLRQEALINLWRSMGRYRAEASLSTWVYRIVFNSCVSYLRQHKKHRVEGVAAYDCSELIAGNDEHAQLLADMYSLINRLGDVDKAIVLMWLDGNSYDEIAEVVGLRQSTIGTRLHRIKDKLVKLSNL